MNLEAINKWLDEEYGCSYTRLEELHDFYFEKYNDLQQENKQIKERVNYLERSNNRREDTILEQRQEISNLEDTYCDRTDCSSRIKDSKKYDSLKQKYDKQVDNWNKLKADLELVVGYCFGDEASRWDKTYGEHAKATLNYMRELEQGSDSNVKD